MLRIITRAVIALLPLLQFSACGLVGAPEPGPEARFYVACISLVDSNVHFVNRSLRADSYTWRFSDGRVSSAVEPTLVFSQSDSIDVTLEARNDDGDVDKITHRVFIHPPIPVTKIIPLKHVLADNGWYDWAALVETVLLHYGVAVENCAIVSKYLDGNCCDSGRTCRPWVSPSNVAATLLAHGPLASTAKSGILLESEIRSEIAQNHPVILWYEARDAFRLLIVNGYDSAGNLHTMDPIRGAGVTTYQNLMRMAVGAEYLDWTSTIHCIRRPT